MTYKEALETIKRGSIHSEAKNAEIINEDAINTAIANAATSNTATANTVSSNASMITSNRSTEKRVSPQLPGTVFRVVIPAGTANNFLNLIEVASPGGISFIIRLPILASLATNGLRNTAISGIMDAIKAAGGTVELLS